MKAFWKAKWFSLVVGLISCGMSIYNMVLDNEYMSLGWLLTACVWIIMAHVEFNNERIKLLEKKQERDDAMYDLVQELLEANKIDRKYAKQLEDRLKKLEEKK